MKTISFEISDEHYKEIENLIIWKNTRNLLTDKDTKYTISDFAKGAMLSKLEEVGKIVSVIGEINSETVVKNNFKQIAKERSIKQADIGRTIGMHKSNLSLIFNNENQPKADVFIKIWALLNCPPIQKCFYIDSE